MGLLAVVAAAELPTGARGRPCHGTSRRFTGWLLPPIFLLVGAWEWWRRRPDVPSLRQWAVLLAALLITVPAVIWAALLLVALLHVTPTVQAAPDGYIPYFNALAGGEAGGHRFFLASSLGLSKQLTGHYQTGLLGFAALAVLALVGLSIIKHRWRTTWGAMGVAGARI